MTTTTSPKRRSTKAKEEKAKMYLVETPEMKRQKILAFKQSFFNRNLPLTVEMIGKYFGVCDSSDLLSVYWEKELTDRQNQIGIFSVGVPSEDPAEWNDDPDGCTPDEYGLKLAKAVREDFFKTGAPLDRHYIYHYFHHFRKTEYMYILLLDYFEKEITQGQHKNYQNHFITDPLTEFEYAD